MQQALASGLRPRITRGLSGVAYEPRRSLSRKRPVIVKAFSEAPAVPAAGTSSSSTATKAPAELSPKHTQLLQEKGPLVKIATHYHVNFGDCLKVVGSSDAFGAWDAKDAPLMVWGEGDVWSLVVNLPPGEHEFKVVVQQASGNLLWEKGDANRSVTVPEDFPVGSMLVSQCSFNIIDEACNTPELEPVTSDVLALLEAQLEEEAAAEEEQARTTQAAAAVANAFATMDAEAESNPIRVRIATDSDAEEDTPEQQQQFLDRSGGPAVVAAAAVAEAPVSTIADQQEQQQQDVAAAAQQLEEALGASSDAEPEAVAAAAAVEEEQVVLAATAAEEMEANMEVMSQEVHPDDSEPAASSILAQASSPAAAVHAKLTRDKPVAVGFMDKPAAPPQATSSVVAAFMKSVGGTKPTSTTAEPSSSQDSQAAVAADAIAADAAATATPIDSSAVTAEPAADTTAAAAAAGETEQKFGRSRAPAAVAAVAVAPVLDQQPAAPAATPASPGSGTVSAPPAAADVPAAEPFPKGWGPTAGAARFPARATPASSTSTSSSTSSATTSGSASGSTAYSTGNYSFSSSSNSGMHGGSSSSSISAGTPPNSPSRLNRPPSPGRGSSHVVSAAAAAAVAAEWIAGVRSNTVVTAAREAEKAANELAERLQQAQQKKSEAAAEAERLHETLKHSSMVRGVVVAGGNGNGYGNGKEAIAAVAAVAGNMGLMAAARSKALNMAEAAMAASSNALNPPPVTPVGGSPVLATVSARGSNGGPSPPPVMDASAGGSRSVSTQAVSGSGALTAAGSFSAATSNADALEGAAVEGDGGWAEGMQMLSAVVGCAAVGTVLWSEFVLKETGCGLPPGPYGLLGAAEGLSYLAVLGFAGAGVGARVNSGGRQGLKGALAVPEGLAYGALAAGLMVLASQLYEYGYIPPPLPGGQCFADSAVAMPGGEELNAQLTAQMAALAGILAQLQSAAADGMNQLHLQEQLATLQAQVDTFSGYVTSQAAVLDSQLQVGLLQLQDSLSTATSAVSTFVDTQLQQLDLSGKLSYVLDILRTQEQQLKVELPKQLAELQQLAATSMAVVQETALQTSTSAHLPELLTSLDQVMGMLHDVLETRIQQLDVVLTQLQGSIGAAAAQLSAAVAAAEQSGSTEAAGQLQGLQVLLADAMSDVQAQVWAGYQQLALADKLSDMLLVVRSSAADVAASAASEVDKLRLQEQLQQLEGLAEASTAALAANALQGINQLQLEDRLNEIGTQAAAAAASLQTGLQQQYEQQLPAVAAQMDALQANLAELADKTEHQLGEHSPELEGLLRDLQSSMETTMKLVGEVASTGVTAAGDAVQAAGGAASTGLTAVNEQLGAATDAVSATMAASSVPEAAATLAQSSAPAAASAVADASTAAAAAAVDANLVAYTLTDGMDVLQLPDAGLEDTATYVSNGLDLSEANDAIKAIWANRPE